jgi:ABC-type sugar transport system ATPase subunit
MLLTTDESASVKEEVTDPQAGLRTPSTQGAAAKSAAAPPLAVKLSGVTKVFGVTLALDEVDVSVRVGEIHALVGENGAGKSTLLGLISGRIRQTVGTVEVFGHKLQAGNPRMSRRLGVAAIYQELTMVPELTAVGNVFLGQTETAGLFLSERRMRTRFDGLLSEFFEGASIPCKATVNSLPVADQQILEILRGVQSQARILLLDEPSASLAEAEREALWRLLRRLKQQGTTIVFVSHNLDEVLAIADWVTVFRDGKVTVTGSTKMFTTKTLVRAMVGRDVEVPSTRTAKPRDRVVLKAERVTVPGRVRDVSLQVREGEILGLAGLVGSGRTSLLRSLAGLEPASHGELTVEGRRVSWPRTVLKALDAGVAMIPDDRRSALVSGMSLGDNVFLGAFDQVTRLLFISERKKSSIASSVLDRFKLRGGGAGSLVESLSGGNRQKVLLAKWVQRNPRVLLVDDPTKGIDVGAKVEVLEILDQLATSGLAIVMASPELEEILAVCDRVLVFRNGDVVRELNSEGCRLSRTEILEHCFGTTMETGIS